MQRQVLARRSHYANASCAPQVESPSPVRASPSARRSRGRIDRSGRASTQTQGSNARARRRKQTFSRCVADVYIRKTKRRFNARNVLFVFVMNNLGVLIEWERLAMHVFISRPCVSAPSEWTAPRRFRAFVCLSPGRTRARKRPERRHFLLSRCSPNFDPLFQHRKQTITRECVTKYTFPSPSKRRVVQTRGGNRTSFGRDADTKWSVR